MPFGLDGLRDERDRFGRRRKLETESVREIFPTFSATHKVP